MYVCVCVCVCGGGGGSMPPLRGFVNEVKKGWMPPPSDLAHFGKEIYSVAETLSSCSFQYSLRNFLMCQLFPKFDILNIILLVSQHEITKSIHVYMYMVTFKLSGLILH